MGLLIQRYSLNFARAVSFAQLYPPRNVRAEAHGTHDIERTHVTVRSGAGGLVGFGGVIAADVKVSADSLALLASAGIHPAAAEVGSVNRQVAQHRVAEIIGARPHRFWQSPKLWGRGLPCARPEFESGCHDQGFWRRRAA